MTEFALRNRVLAAALCAALAPVSLSGAALPGEAPADDARAAESGAPSSSRPIRLAPAARLHGTAPYAALSIAFEPDVKACEADFGRDALARCRVTFARAGTPERGVRLSPAHPGSWRWTGPMTLTFTPEKPWPSKRAFSAVLDGLGAPVGSTIASTRAAFETPPLAANRSELRFWMDPTEKGERVLTLEAAFTTAPDQAAFERALRIRTEGVPADEAPTFGRPAFLWAEDGLSVYVRVPVVRLGRTAAAVTAQAPGIAGQVRWNPLTNGWTIPKGREMLLLSASVPGRETLMSAALERTIPVQNEALESRYEITLTTSLRVTPEALARALEVRLLPERMDPSSPRPTEWSGAARIDPQSWSSASPVAFETLGTPGVAAVRHRIRIAGEPGRFVALRLPAGFGPDEFTLKDDFTAATLLAETRPSVALLHPGNLITRSGAARVSIAASGVDAVRWRIARINDGFSLLAMEGYDTLAQPSDLEERSTIVKEGVIALERSPDASFASLNLAEVRQAAGPGLYTLTLEGLLKDDQDPKAELRTAAEETRRVLMSDLAVLAKTHADQTMSVFVSDLVREEPVRSAEVTLLAANGTPLARARTDEDGFAPLPSVKGLEREKRPTAIVVRSGSDAQWLALADPALASRSLSEAMRFGGRRTGDADGAALTAFAFTERGVYRPGETIRWSAVVRDADGRQLPAHLPLRLEVVSFEQGKILEETVLPGEGLVARDIRLPADLFGRVRLNLIAGEWNVLASTVVAVEAFEAETMRLSAAPEPPGWRSAESVALDLEARHLAGAAAEGLSLSGHAVISPIAGGAMPGHPEFTLAMPSGRRPETRREALRAVKTDAAGRARLELDASALAEGLSSVRFDVEGTSPDGGRTATFSRTMLAGRSDLLCGWRLVDNAANPSFLAAGDPAEAEILVIGPDLKPVPGVRLAVRTARAERVTELIEGPGGRLGYVETPVRSDERVDFVTTDASGRARFDLPTGEPGEGILEVARDQGGVLLEAAWRVAGTDLRSAKAPELPAADMRLALASTQLHAGGELSLALVSPFEGYGLVTLEDRRVRWSEWIRVKPGENAIKLRLPEKGLVPGRQYLHVSLIRSGLLPDDQGSPEDVERRRSNAARLRSGYAEAIAPVTMDVEQRRLKVGMTTSSANGALRVSVSSDRPAKAVIHAVDEGILALTNHPAPDPLQALYLDRALEVTTLEALSRQMPEGLSLPKPLVWGGDIERMASGAPASNPFARTPAEAAVWTSGIVDIGPEARTFDVALPEGWHGRVRMTAVAAQEDGPAVGRAVESAERRMPLMLDPVLPLAVAPGDRFRAGGTVLLGQAPEGERTISAGVAVAGERQVVSIGASGAAGFGTMIDAPDEPGVLAVPIEASATIGRRLATVRRTAEVSVRPAVLPRREAAAGFLAPRADGASETTLPELEALAAVPGVRSRAVVSTRPLSWVSALVAPSSEACGPVPADVAAAEALGYFAVMNDAELRRLLPGDSDEPLRRRKRLIEAGDRGGMDADLALAAAHLAMPPEMDPAPDVLRAVAARLERTVTTSPETLDEARAQLAALWLLIREGTLVADRLAALTARMSERFPQWRRDPAAILAGAAYARMRMTKEALALLAADIRPEGLSLRTLAWTKLALTDAARLTESVFPAEAAVRAALLASTEDAVARGGPSLLDAAWTAAALSGDAAGSSLPESLELVCSAYAPGFAAEAQARRTSAALALDAPGCTRFAVKGAAAEPLYWSTLSAGSPAGLPSAPLVRGLAVSKRYLNAEGKPSESFRVGELVTVELRIEGSGRLLVSDPLPGGFMHADQPGETPSTGQAAAVSGFMRAEDRFLVRLTPYGDNGSAGPVTVRYAIRAVTPGTFAAGPAAVEDDANPARLGAGAARTLTVK